MAVLKNTAQRWKKITKTNITQGYGLTETSPVVSVNIISDELGKLTNLKTITLHGNPLVHFSDKCLSLNNLFYDNSDLNNIPDFIFNLKIKTHINNNYNLKTKI
jgi:acyl-CoA synthetase (AMP-forming)/AMP-acid ligase II